MDAFFIATSPSGFVHGCPKATQNFQGPRSAGQDRLLLTKTDIAGGNDSTPHALCTCLRGGGLSGRCGVFYRGVFTIPSRTSCPSTGYVVPDNAMTQNEKYKGKRTQLVHLARLNTDGVFEANWKGYLSPPEIGFRGDLWVQASVHMEVARHSLLDSCCDRSTWGRWSKL